MSRCGAQAGRRRWRRQRRGGRAGAAAAESDLAYGDERCPITTCEGRPRHKAKGGHDRWREFEKNAARRQIALPIC